MMSPDPNEFFSSEMEQGPHRDAVRVPSAWAHLYLGVSPSYLRTRRGDHEYGPLLIGPCSIDELTGLRALLMRKRPPFKGWVDRLGWRADAGRGLIVVAHGVSPGCGRTTLAVHLALFWSLRGWRVVVIDGATNGVAGSLLGRPGSPPSFSGWRDGEFASLPALAGARLVPSGSWLTAMDAFARDEADRLVGSALGRLAGICDAVVIDTCDGSRFADAASAEADLSLCLVRAAELGAPARERLEASLADLGRTGGLPCSAQLVVNAGLDGAHWRDPLPTVDERTLVFPGVNVPAVPGPTLYHGYERGGYRASFLAVRDRLEAFLRAVEHLAVSRLRRREDHAVSRTRTLSEHAADP